MEEVLIIFPFPGFYYTFLSASLLARNEVIIQFEERYLEGCY